MTTSIHVPACRGLSRLAPALTMAIACLASGAAFGQSLGADNPYSPAYGHSYRHGVVPTREALQHMKEYATFKARPGGGGHNSNTLSFGGGVDGIGVTSGSPKVYLVVWGSQWGTQNGNSFSGDPAGAVPYLVNMFQGLGTGGELWSGVMTQYCDGSAVSRGATSCPSNADFVGYPSSTVYAGLWYDNASAAPSQASYQQIGQEAVAAAAHFGNTTAASNRYVQYVILSPSGTHPDGFNTAQGNFCAWHDWNGDLGVSSPYGDIALTNMPYVLDLGASCGQNFVNSGSAGMLDGFSIVEGHEYAETITDQNPAGGWTASSGYENADECAWISSGQGASANVTMGNGHYAMQSTWSNDTNECDLAHAIVTGGGGGGGGGGGAPVASFSYTANGTSVSFTDTSTCSATPCSYAWNFGDGASSTQQSPSHVYSSPGSYTVTETVTDSNSASDSTSQNLHLKKH